MVSVSFFFFSFHFFRMPWSRIQISSSSGVNPFPTDTLRWITVGGSKGFDSRWLPQNRRHTGLSKGSELDARLAFPFFPFLFFPFPFFLPLVYVCAWTVPGDVMAVALLASFSDHRVSL